MPVVERDFNVEPLVKEPEPIARHYKQSLRALDNLPQTTHIPNRELDPNIPNIFSLDATELPILWQRQEEADVDRKEKVVYAAKADIGGNGGHVEVEGEVEAVFADTLLRYNRYGERGTQPIFRSLTVDHTGDDVAVVAVVDRSVAEDHLSVADEVAFEAFMRAGAKAQELGQYGPWQDIKKDAFTGNLHGLGPARVILPLPLHKQNQTQVVLVASGDKTEPGLFNHVAKGAYYDPRYNSGLLLADSAMGKGYVFEIVDLNTKAVAMEEGISPTDHVAMDQRMAELGEVEKVIRLSANSSEHYDIATLLLDTSRNVVARIYSKDENGEPDKLGYVVSAERLHNIQTEKGFTYGGKDDPILLALCQGDWPAPGEITSPFANTPLVAGDCRGSHWMYIYPSPINSPTTYWSGPIVIARTYSINTHSGRIGSIADQFPAGSQWDQYRLDSARKNHEHRVSHGDMAPGVLPADELEYQPGRAKKLARLASKWKSQPPRAF